MKKKIILIGPVPPPYGGVSVHVLRLASKVNATDDFECAIFDIGRMSFYDKNNNRKNLLQAISYFISASIVHLHISHPVKYFIARVAKLLGKKVVITHHNIREDSDQASLKLHKIADAIIKVYKKPAEILDFKTKVIPAFIPTDSLILLDNKFKNNLVKYKTVIASISTHPKKDFVKIQNKDIYGFDLLLKAYPSFFQAGQVLLLLNSNGEMNNELQSEVEKLKNDGFPIICIDTVVDFLALLPHVSIFVRPTRSDGDSIAIREALAAGVKVLASDCVSRPAGVVLFKDDDAGSLAVEMKKLINSPKPNPIHQYDNSIKLLEVYRSLG